MKKKINLINKKYFKYIVILSIILILLLIKPFLYWNNDTFGITRYNVTGNIPKSFDNYKIVQISDLHCRVFGGTLAKAIINEKPDVIFLTGDLIDEGVPDHTSTYNLIKEISNVAHMYAVSGNHDKWYKHFDKHQEKLANLGVKLLENTQTTITKNGESINIYGIADPYVWGYDEAASLVINNDLKKLNIKDGYNILLFHRANMLDLFKDIKFDLIFSGHIHGGQIRLPFIGGLYSPHNIWFPKYSGGKYDENGKTYIVSRGFGTAFVPRIFNQPELVVVTLKSNINT